MDEKALKAQAEALVEKVKALVKEGNVSRVMLKRKGETLVNLPVNAGILGAVVGLSAAPFAVLSTALVSFGLDCELEVEKKDGSVINLNETPVGEKLEGVKDAVEAKVKELAGKDAADPPAENA